MQLRSESGLWPTLLCVCTERRGPRGKPRPQWDGIWVVRVDARSQRWGPRGTRTRSFPHGHTAGTRRLAGTWPQTSSLCSAVGPVCGAGHRARAKPVPQFPPSQGGSRSGCVPAPEVTPVGVFCKLVAHAHVVVTRTPAGTWAWNVP